jgi:hypothetical protein
MTRGRMGSDNSIAFEAQRWSKIAEPPTPAPPSSGTNIRKREGWERYFLV